MRKIRENVVIKTYIDNIFKSRVMSNKTFWRDLYTRDY